MTGPHEIELDDGRKVSAAKVVLATGSRPREIPGFSFDEKTVLSSTGALMAQDLPKRLLVLGAGAIGMELAYVMSAFGVEVTVVELLPRALPLEDPEASDLVAKEFGRQGVKILTGTRALGMKAGPKGVSVTLKGPDGTESSVTADRILVAVGRAPNSEGLGLEGIGVRTERGFVQTGDYMETSQLRDVYAIGDLVPTPALAHVASKEGEIAAEHAASVLKGLPLPRRRTVDPLLVPSAVYCDPQVASFGLSEAASVEAGIHVDIARFPYRGIGKAVAVDRAEGFIKLIHEARTGEILGATVVGEAATEVIQGCFCRQGSGTPDRGCCRLDPRPIPRSPRERWKRRGPPWEGPCTRDGLRGRGAEKKVPPRPLSAFKCLGYSELRPELCRRCAAGHF